LVAFPAKGSVRFVAEQCGAGKFHLDIFNVTGQLVWNYQGTSWGKGPAQVMLPKDIGQGLYIAFLREGNETALEKFVVENR
jgi:hypothetical protein